MVVQGSTAFSKSLLLKVLTPPPTQLLRNQFWKKKLLDCNCIHKPNHSQIFESCYCILNWIPKKEGKCNCIKKSWPQSRELQLHVLNIPRVTCRWLHHFGCGFLLTIGSFLLTVELFYLQLTIWAFLVTIATFFAYNSNFSTYSWSFLLTVGKCV